MSDLRQDANNAELRANYPNNAQATYVRYSFTQTHNNKLNGLKNDKNFSVYNLAIYCLSKNA